jgi:hypothetical protein
MRDDAPTHPVARAPAPAYAGEGSFVLWHFSEDPTLERFDPHVPGVWAIDSRHAPMFWFPRDCPRGCIWPVATTSPEDRETFFGQSEAERIHVMESDWLARMQSCSLFAYRLPTESFRPHDEVGGYWVSDQTVWASERVVVDDLPGRHARAGIELRITPSLWPFWRRVVASTVEYSGHRLRNAAPPPDQVCT